MAKLTNCVFCNKELTKGFFSEDVERIDLGGGSLTCCTDCYKKYRGDAKRIRKRFGTKIENLKKAGKRKLSENELAEMFLLYLKEEAEQIAKCGEEEPEKFVSFFGVNEKGYFSVKEQPISAVNTDVTARQMIKTIKKSDDFDSVCFDKDDITKLEFRPTGVGDTLTLFSTAYSYEIRLNDEKVLTYKPCIAKIAVVGQGLFTRKSADKQLYKMLEVFRMCIGSDLPVTKVKKFM